MPRPTPASPSQSFPPLLAAALLVGAIVLCYGNSLRVPFVFDDPKSIAENPSIRRLFSPEIFAPPHGGTVAGRPLLNASLALNYALGRTDVRGYHAVNIAIHAAAALALFGLLRRTLRSTEIAWVGALLWALHPLQTESVTYVIQRAEALMALFYLLTLYCFARGAATESCSSRGNEAGPDSLVTLGATPSIWFVLSVVFCACGMATKEVMVSTPLVVALYDRVFIAGSWAGMARRWRYYAALGATWLLLAWLVSHAGDRGGTAGFSVGATVWGYALTQCRAILLYLRLALWPDPLVFDYGPYAAPEVRAFAPAALTLLVLLAAVAWLARRRPAFGFAAAGFFLTLAPTSSVLPIVTEPIAEHRLYLPLAAVAALAAWGIFHLGTRRGLFVGIMLAFGLGWLTVRRNEVYANERSLWSATVAAAPGNPRAHYSLALALGVEGEAHYRAALALRPDYVGARHSYAQLLTEQSRLGEAREQYRAILRIQPDDFTAHSGLGTVEFQAGDFAAAATHFREAVRLRPEYAEAHNNLGCVLYELGDWAAARAHEEIAVRLDPGTAQNHYNLGNTLFRLGLPREARAAYERALALAPNYAEAHINLGAALESLGDRAGAIAHYRDALRLQPGHAFARQRLDTLLR